MLCVFRVCVVGVIVCVGECPFCCVLWCGVMVCFVVWLCLFCVVMFRFVVWFGVVLCWLCVWFVCVFVFVCDCCCVCVCAVFLCLR